MLALHQQQQQLHQQQQMTMHGHQGQQVPEHVLLHHVSQQGPPQLQLIDEYSREDQHNVGNKRKAPSSPPSARKKPAFNEHKAKRAEGPPPTPLWSIQMVSNCSLSTWFLFILAHQYLQYSFWRTG